MRRRIERKEEKGKGKHTTAINPTPLRGDGGHEDDPSPLLRSHAVDDALHQHETRAQVDVQRILELLKRDIPISRKAKHLINIICHPSEPRFFTQPSILSIYFVSFLRIAYMIQRRKKRTYQTSTILFPYPALLTKISTTLPSCCSFTSLNIRAISATTPTSTWWMEMRRAAAVLEEARMEDTMAWIPARFLE